MVIWMSQYDSSLQLKPSKCPFRIRSPIGLGARRRAASPGVPRVVARRFLFSAALAGWAIAGGEPARMGIGAAGARTAGVFCGVEFDICGCIRCIYALVETKIDDKENFGSVPEQERFPG